MINEHQVSESLKVMHKKAFFNVMSERGRYFYELLNMFQLNIFTIPFVCLYFHELLVLRYKWMFSFLFLDPTDWRDVNYRCQGGN